VDYVLCRKKDLQRLLDCKVIPGKSVTKQHRPVVCKMMLESKKRKILQTRELKTKWWKLNDNTYHEKFKEKVEQVINGKNALPENWVQTAEIVHETAKEVFGVATGKRKDDHETWWWSEEVQRCVKEKREAKKEMGQEQG